MFQFDFYGTYGTGLQSLVEFLERDQLPGIMY